MRSIQTRRLLLLVPLALGLLAGSVASPSVTHAQIAHAMPQAASERQRVMLRGLSARDRALFVPVLPSIARCNVDLSTVTADLQQASDNLNAGSMDMGSLRSDAVAMRNDCLDAAAQDTRLRVPAGATHALARRVQSELHAALVDFAQGAYDCVRVVDALGAGHANAAVGALRHGTGAWKAAQAHLRVATSYVR